MKKSVLSLLTAFIFVVGFSIKLNAAAEHDLQADGMQVNTQRLFKSFLKEGAPLSSHCDECRADCPRCATDCWPQDGICNTCKKEGNCPSHCSDCSNCHYCKGDGFCCFGINCHPKPSTCH